MSGKPSF